MTALDDDILGKAYDARLMRRFLGYLRPHGGLVALCAVVLLALTAFELAAPLVMKGAVDGPILAGDRDGVTRWALAFLGVLLGTGALEFVHAWLTQLAGQRVCNDLRRDVFAHLQRLPLAFYDRNPVGRLVIRVTSDIESLKELFASGLISVTANVITLAGIVGILFAVNPVLARDFLVVVPFMIGVALVFRAYARRYYRDIRQRIARLNAYLNENVMGMRVVQLFNREAHNRAVFERLNEDHRRACLKSVHAYALFFPAITSLVIVSLALLLRSGGGLILDGALTYGEFIAFWVYAQKFYHPIIDLAEKHNVLQAAMASSERIFKLLDTPVPIASPPDAPPPPERGRPAHPSGQAPLKGEIEFRDVSFAYDGGATVLDGLSLHVRPGEHVALVGATGGGKTTLASLLIRLYDVRGGRILVDGVDVREWRLPALRRQVAVVLQDVFCFAGTIASNIRLGEAGIDDARVAAAARLVNADRIAARRPGGFAAEVPERGATYSAGEKQLIGFARALAFDPRILVLDEATSHVDTETEALIQDGLRKAIAGRTAIVIAHRLSTLQACDRILVLHKGTIREEGTHAELLKRGGIYAKLYELQVRGPAPTATPTANGSRP